MTATAGDLADRQALLLLAHMVEPGDRQVGRLVRRWGPVEAVRKLVDASGGLRQQESLAARLTGVEPREVESRATACGARVVTRVDREWPSQLDDLDAAAPYALWVAGAGDLRLAALRSVAIVGARACSMYGEEVARSWSAELAAEGWTVVSGGAFGIDAAAHRGALAAGGVTACILAGGVDVPYPRAHDALIARIADEGLVVSESPPGEAVRRQRFLSRNRLISALTRATVVVEAAERSGTMATAQAAVAMNRPLLAVPGPVTSPASTGCHRMVRDGEAVLAASIDDVLGLLDLGRDAGAPAKRSDERDALSAQERCVLDAMPGRGAVTTERLAVASGFAVLELLGSLGGLEATGWVQQDAQGWRLAARSGTRTTRTGRA